MVPLLLLAAALADDPRITGVERLLGEIRRPWQWAPLAVTLASEAGFRGDLEVKCPNGFRVVREVDVPPGGRIREVLPSLDPQEVGAGASRVRVPSDPSPAELLVCVDARLPFGADLVSDDRILFRRIEPADLRRLLDQGLLEACDFLLLKDDAGLSLGGQPHAVTPTLDEARGALKEGLRPDRNRIQWVDAAVWEGAPGDGWVPAKRNMGLFLAVIYGFAGFLALAWTARRRPELVPGAAAAVAVLGLGAFAFAYPRGQLWTNECGVEVVPREGDSVEWRLWFVGAAAPVTTSVSFPRVVKPVLPDALASEPGVTLRILEPGCRIEALSLAAGRSLCFATSESRVPAFRALDVLPAPLHRATLLRNGRNRSLGDLAAGAAVPEETPREDEPAPRDPAFRPFRRFVQGDSLFGWLDAGERAATDVHSPELADARRRPRLLIQRLR